MLHLFFMDIDLLSPSDTTYMLDSRFIDKCYASTTRNLSTSRVRNIRSGRAYRRYTLLTVFCASRVFNSTLYRNFLSTEATAAEEHEHGEDDLRTRDYQTTSTSLPCRAVGGA